MQPTDVMKNRKCKKKAWNRTWKEKFIYLPLI